MNLKLKYRENYTQIIFNECFQRRNKRTGKIRTSIELIRVILDAKYENEDLNKVNKNQYQHLTGTQSNELLKKLQK